MKTIDCKADTAWKTLEDTNITRTDKAGSQQWTAVSPFLGLVLVSRTVFHVVSALQSIVSIHFLADQISCRSYVGSVYRMPFLTKKTLGDRAFLAAAPKLWNGLPSQIRNEPNFNRFKGLLKTHFFRLAFY